MSLKMMIAAMEAEVGNSTSKLVLVKLADNANEKGECWPSYETIARVCECSVKTAQRHIAKLEDMGLISKTERKNDRGNQSNLYKITISKAERQNDATPSDKMTPPERQNDATPSDKMTPLGGDKMTPKSVNLESVITESIIESLSLSGGVSVNSLNDFVCHRKKIKKPMTEQAVKLFIGRLSKLSLEGHIPDELIEDAIIAGWQTIYPKGKGKSNLPKNKTFRDQVTDRNREVFENFLNSGE